MWLYEWVSGVWLYEGVSGVWLYEGVTKFGSTITAQCVINCN